MTSPAGSVSIAQELLRTSLADCAAFRTWCGAADAAAALLRIHHEAVTPPATDAEYTAAELAALRPHAIVWTVKHRWRQNAAGTHFETERGGQLQARLVQTVDPAIATDEGEIGRRFMNAVGTIVDQLFDLAGTAGYLAIIDVEMDSPLRTHPDAVRDLGDVVMVDLNIDWGPF